MDERKKSGEFAVDAAILGDLGKKVIIVSGNDKVCAEAKAISPEIITAEVNKRACYIQRYASAKKQSTRASAPEG